MAPGAGAGADDRRLRRDSVRKGSMSEDYVRFDQSEDALASVELIALLAPLVRDKPHYWKWIIIGAHNALQGAMVCAFTDSTETSILEKKSAAKVREWDNTDESTRGEHPEPRLANFEKLLKLGLRGSHNHEPLLLTRQQCRDIRRLRGFRNNFIHFTPKGWSIEKVGLPRIVEAALDAAEGLLGRHYVTVLMDEDQQQRFQQRLTDALSAVRTYLRSSVD
jgi:hypothetical protein